MAALDSPSGASFRLARGIIPWLLGSAVGVACQLCRPLRAIWWSPLVALTALVLGRFVPLSRAYCLVFGPNWIVIYNAGFCRIAMAPATSRVPGVRRR